MFSSTSYSGKNTPALIFDNRNAAQSNKLRSSFTSSLLESFTFTSSLLVFYFYYLENTGAVSEIYYFT